MKSATPLALLSAGGLKAVEKVGKLLATEMNASLPPLPQSDACHLTAAEGWLELGNLVMDLSPIGIPTTTQTFALRAEGDSMTGTGIHDGDIVILEKRPPRSGDIVAALLDAEMTLKRYVVEADKHLLRAANPKFKDIPLNEASVVQGVAVGLIRKL